MIKAQSRERSELSWLLGLMALMFVAAVLSGCNTARGMGEDIEAAGGAMSDTAEDVEEDM